MKNQYPLPEKNKTKKQKKQKKTTKQSTKIIVHLENGACIKLTPYHQDPDLFHRNHSTVKNIFTYF